MEYTIERVVCACEGLYYPTHSVLCGPHMGYGTTLHTRHSTGHSRFFLAAPPEPCLQLASRQDLVQQPASTSSASGDPPGTTGGCAPGRGVTSGAA